MPMPGCPHVPLAWTERTPSYPHKIYRTAVARLLGQPVFSSSVPCPLCEQTMDILGDHPLCCKKSGDRITRHNRLGETLLLCPSCCTANSESRLCGLVRSRRRFRLTLARLHEPSMTSFSISLYFVLLLSYLPRPPLWLINFRTNIVR